MNHHDVFVRKLHARVFRGDPLIAPFRDGAQENVRQYGAAEFQVLRDAGQIVDRYNRAHDGGKVEYLAALHRGQFLVGHGHIGSAEIHGAIRHALHSPARTVGLIVDLHAGMRLAELAEPRLVYRVRKGGAARVEFLRRRQWGSRRQKQARQGQ